MKLPSDVREQFRKFGASGGRKRARRLSSAEKAAVARRAALRRWIAVRFGGLSLAALGLPGGELVDTGLDDLAAGRESMESLMISLAAPRLRREGIPLPKEVLPDADTRLYRWLERTSGELAHARYLACLRQMESFTNACASVRVKRSADAK